jgi:hypothetical protein
MDSNLININKKLKKVKIYEREITKNAIISGKEHKAHYSDKIISSKNPCFTFQCKCKCYSKFTDEQIRHAFKQYYSFKNHSQQYSHLKGIITNKIHVIKLRFLSCLQI